MFGSYLKSIRTTLGLTQEQASIRLNLLGGDLANIDCVTFSRWERGITQPSLSRRVRVLRAFENNLLPYLCSLGVDSSLKDDVEQFELSLKQRYQDAISILSGIGIEFSFENAQNPFPWLSEVVDTAAMTNFFERKVKDYQNSGVLEDDF